ncbi:hypothetical protein LX69_03350 [Breznakibacter xylanolyticus]|uniref:Uncharacterized protein n=1 Tax=Breznakibacter xylanolyticus TaxID=990 RepID=A0A2W7MRP0_9BACT|nr:hypothetical protein LX69_03350 [Breznakibacter xylanolyticus]
MIRLPFFMCDGVFNEHRGTKSQIFMKLCCAFEIRLNLCSNKNADNSKELYSSASEKNNSLF